MPSYRVETPQRSYDAVVERGIIGQTAKYVPSKAGKIFVVTTEDVWRHQGRQLADGLEGIAYEILTLPGGEDQKRLAPVEQLAGQMIQRGGDRTSMVIAFGGGIVNDMGGFLAAIFMRGIPVLQVPDHAAGPGRCGDRRQDRGQPGERQESDRQLPPAPGGPDRSGGAGFAARSRIPRRALRDHQGGHHSRREALRISGSEPREDVLARTPEAVDRIIADSVRMKAEVVSGDEKENDLRRILNFGHTFGHALEAETRYVRFLHGEAVAWGMRAAVYLAEMTGHLSAEESVDILEAIQLYGPIPPRGRHLRGKPARPPGAR